MRCAVLPNECSLGNGEKRRGDVVLRDGRVFPNVAFYEYRLMAVGPRPFRLPFTADQLAVIRLAWF